MKHPTWINWFRCVIKCLAPQKVWFFFFELLNFGVKLEQRVWLILFIFGLKWRHLSVEKNRVLFVKLFPEISNLTRDNPPIASFIVRVVSSVGDRKAITHPGLSFFLLFVFVFGSFYFFFCYFCQFIGIKFLVFFLWIENNQQS